MKLETWIKLGGILHLGLCLISLPIPWILGWKEQVKKMEPLTGMIFWTYAGYIWTIHLFFALISLICSMELATTTKLSIGITSFITVYWVTRVILQMTCFRFAHPPQKSFEKVGEVLLLFLFVGMISIYGFATWRHFSP